MQAALETSKLHALRYFVCHLGSPLISYNSVHRSQRITETESDWEEPVQRLSLISSAKPVKRSVVCRHAPVWYMEMSFETSGVSAMTI